MKARFAVVLALALGVVVGALLNRWPSWATNRHAYCTMCAAHHEGVERTPVLGRHRSETTRNGILARLLQPTVGEHGHVWSVAAYVAPTNPPPKLNSHDAFQQTVLEAEVRDLESLEESPHAIAILDEAMRNDRARTVRFIQRLLDPTAFVPVDAIGLLDRAGTWEERWAIVDAFFDAYHCDATDVSASCRLRAGSTDLLVLVRTTTSVHSGGVDWTHWVPTGMTAPPGATTPQTYAAVTVTGS